MKFPWREYRAPVVIASAFFVLGVLRINDLSLYTDSTRYVIWGTSVAHARGFVDDTQPVPEAYVVNAPLYSVILAPALLFSPFSMAAAKIWTLALAAASIILYYRWLLVHMQKRAALVCISFFAFNPLTLVISTEALSEAPFLLLLFYIFVRFEQLERSPRSHVGLPLVLALAVLPLLREVSIALVGAALLYLVLQNKLVPALQVIVVGGLLFGLWTFRNLVLVGAPPSSQAPNLQFIFERYVTPQGSSIFREMFVRMVLNTRAFAFELGGLLLFLFPANLMVDATGAFHFVYHLFAVAKGALVVLILPPLLLGFSVDILRNTTARIRLVFILLYLLVILTYPIHDVRFLLPLLPLYLFYIALGFERVFRWCADRQVAVVRPLLFVLAFGSLVPNLLCVGEVIRTNLAYVHSPEDFYKRLRTVHSSNEYFTQPWEVAGTWLQRHTPNDAVIASSVKEISTFIGGRKLLEINNGVPLPLFEVMLRDNAVQYVLAPTLWDDFRSYQFHMNESRRFSFDSVFAVAGLTLFRAHAPYLHPTPVERNAARIDSSTASGLMMLGRAEILDGQFRTAAAHLAQAQNLAPAEASIRFQSVVALALAGDSDRAASERNALFLMPRATPYLWATRLHINAMNGLREAETDPSPSTKTEKLSRVASLYWSLGYGRKAYAIERASVAADPNFFVGLLWSWHYGMQLGDTLQADHYLRQLEAIDKSNPVVRTFRTITQLDDSLRHSRDRRLRAHVRTRIAQEYAGVDLPEEAVDQLEIAMAENGRTEEIQKVLDQIYAAKGRPEAAKFIGRAE